MKFFADFLLKFWDLSGAKVLESQVEKRMEKPCRNSRTEKYKRCLDHKPWITGAVQRIAYLLDLAKCRKMSIWHYLVAKIGLDTAENEPSKVWWFGWKIGVRFEGSNLSTKARYSSACGKGRLPPLLVQRWRWGRRALGTRRAVRAPGEEAERAHQPGLKDSMGDRSNHSNLCVIRVTVKFLPKFIWIC